VSKPIVPLTLLVSVTVAAIVYASFARRVATKCVEDMGGPGQPQSKSPGSSTPRDRSENNAAVEKQAGPLALALVLAVEPAARSMEAMLSIARTGLDTLDTLAQEACARTQRSSEQAIGELDSAARAGTAGDLWSIHISHLAAWGQLMLDQAVRTTRIAEVTGQALIEGCAAHARETAAARG
jgi:hypothetical protein